ncbi:MAG: phosphate ABC transporter permease PstA [Deltaproteobacteria bacterium]|jgi:phosphate transport system permease protein|nr:phosphate ABC transporter permease PstA [Deltaproteobacteria bacterium]
MSGLRRRKIVNIVAMSLAAACAAAGLFLLFVILYDVLVEGMGSLRLRLFTQDPAPPNIPGAGGLRSAFLGQGLLTLAASVVGVPVGVLGGTFLAEYGRHYKICRLISTLSDMAVSIPSIVIGTFVYAVLVKPMGGFNGWAGAAALAIIILPIILRTTEEMMTMVPWSLREAAFALGAPYCKVITSIVWRSAMSGIFTGVLLAVARVAGETAPLLFTSFNSNFFQLGLNRATPSLTVSIYQYAASPYETWVETAWAAAFVVTFLVLLLNVVGRIFIKIKKVG